MSKLGSNSAASVELAWRRRRRRQVEWSEHSAKAQKTAAIAQVWTVVLTFVTAGAAVWGVIYTGLAERIFEDAQSAKSELRELDAKLVDLRAQVAAKASELDSKTEEVNARDRTLAQKDSDIAAKTAVIASRDKAIRKRSDELSQLHREIGSLSSERTALKERVEKLQAQLRANNPSVRYAKYCAAQLAELKKKVEVCELRASTR